MAIADTVGNFVDKPSADEGDLPEEDFLGGFTLSDRAYSEAYHYPN